MYTLALFTLISSICDQIKIIRQSLCSVMRLVELQTGYVR